MRRPAIRLVLLVVVLPTARHGSLWSVLTACLVAAGLSLLWWRTHPRAVAPTGGAWWPAAAALAGHGWSPTSPSC